MTEVEHMIYKNCRNAARGRQTNFARITVSPEALADFISKATIAAWFAQVNGELPNPTKNQRIEVDPETVSVVKGGKRDEKGVYIAPLYGE